MNITLFEFGWQEETKTAELEALEAFLSKNGKPEHADALYALLLAEVECKSYPEDSTLCIEDNQLRLSQYDEKEYYHDGSEQSRKIVNLYCIDQETYLKKLEHGSKEEPDAHNFDQAWLACGEERFFDIRGFFRDDRLLYIKNFFGISYVKIEIFHAI